MAGLHVALTANKEEEERWGLNKQKIKKRKARIKNQKLKGGNKNTKVKDFNLFKNKRTRI